MASRRKLDGKQRNSLALAGSGAHPTCVMQIRSRSNFAKIFGRLRSVQVADARKICLFCEHRANRATDGASVTRSAELPGGRGPDERSLNLVGWLFGRELGFKAEAIQNGNRSQDGAGPILVPRIEQGAPKLDDITAGVDAVDMGKIANMPADLESEIGVEVFGPSFLQQRVGVVLVGDDKFEAIDDVAYAGGLLRCPIGDHGFVGGRHAARECDDPLARTHLDRQVRGHRPPLQRTHDAARQALLVQAGRSRVSGTRSAAARSPGPGTAVERAPVLARRVARLTAHRPSVGAAAVDRGGGIRIAPGNDLDHELTINARHARYAPRGFLDLSRRLRTGHHAAQKDLARGIDRQLDLSLDRRHIEGLRQVS